MAGLAHALARGGFAVSASGPGTSDATGRTLRGSGIRVDAGHLARSAHLLIHGPGVDRTCPERLAAARRGVPEATGGAVLDRLVRGGLGVAVAGSRGASVAAAMVAWTLVRAGLDPTVVLGCSSPQLGGPGRWGLGPHRVVEAVEDRGELSPRSPEVALILEEGTGSTGDSSGRAGRLKRFAASVPGSGLVLGWGADPATVRALAGVGASAELISLGRGCAWWGADLRERDGRFRFRAFHRGRFVVEVRLRVPGRRPVVSALAAVAICGRLGLSAGTIREALEEFAGLARGLESRGSYRGVTLVDDAAPDPSAAAEALALCRRLFGARRLWAVIRPETPRAWVDRAADLAEADLVIVAEPGPRAGGGGQGAWPLVHALGEAGVRARWAADLDGAIADLDRDLEPGDVLLTLGGPDVGTIADALRLRSTRRLAGDRQGR